MVNQPVNMEVESEDPVHTPNGKSCPVTTPISSNQCGAVDSHLDLEVSKEKDHELDPQEEQGLSVSLSGGSAATDSNNVNVSPALVDPDCSTEVSDESQEHLALISSFDSTNLIQDGEDISMSPDKADKQEPTCSNNKSTHPNPNNKIVYFVNKDAKITPSPVLQYLLDIDQPYDTIISCADGKIGAHRLVLASASSFIRSLFTSFNHRLGEVGALILPDVRLHIMKIILNFCYTSKMIFSEEDQQEVMDVMKMLYLGENGDWSFTQVITRQQREEKSSHSRSNSANQEDAPNTEVENSSFNEQRPNSRSSRRKQVDLIDSPSSHHSDEYEPNSSENEDDNINPQFNRNLKGRETVNLISLPASFLLNKAQMNDNDDAPYDYLIPPAHPNIKIKKLQCYYCVGAFKSVETLSLHLENNHGVMLEPIEVDEQDMEKILDCGRCNESHKKVSAANSCLSRGHLTRCYFCLEIFKGSEFATHIKEHHVIKQKDRMSVVRCKWCTAGLVLQEPLDNKAIAAHCYSVHFSNVSPQVQKKVAGNRKPSSTGNSRNTEAVSCVGEGKDEPEKPGSSDTDTDSLFSPIGTPKPSKKSVFLTPQFPSPSLVSRTVSHPKQKEGHKRSTILNKNKEVPRIIQMFQNHKTGLKRKRTSGESDTDGNDCVTVSKDKKESQEEHDRKKRPRHDETPQLKSLKPQVARRTGIPVGRHYDTKDFDISKLRDGVPQFMGHKLGRNNKEYSVNIILNQLPKVFVGLNYDKKFISGVIALRNPPREDEESQDGEDEKQEVDLPHEGNKDLTINLNDEKEISKDCENVSSEDVKDTENENLHERNDDGGDNENVENLQNNDNVNHDEIDNSENNGSKGDGPCVSVSNLLEANTLEVVNTPIKSLEQVTQDESVSSPQKSTRISGVNTPNKLILQVTQDESVSSPRKSTRIAGVNTPNKLILQIAQDESVLSPRRSARISGVKPPTPPKVLKF